MFSCKVCAEKEIRIKELKEQIEYLKSLTIPDNNSFNPTPVEQEYDQVISGATDKVEYDEDPELDKIESEQTRILIGTY